MRKILKYELRGAYKDIVVSSEGAVFLHVGVQNNRAVVWAVVDLLAAPKNYTIYHVLTGFEVLEHHGKYLGTVQMKEDDGADFVEHIYLETE